MWEQIEASHARVYTTYRGWQHVKKRGSIPRIEDGAEGLTLALVAGHWSTSQHSNFNPERTTGTDWIVGLFGTRTSQYILEEGKSLTPAGNQIPGHPAHSLVTSQISYLFWGNKTNRSHVLIPKSQWHTLERGFQQIQLKTERTGIWGR